MSRTLPAAVSAAITQSVTRPIYLIRMGWSAEVRVATWNADISWNAETWTASGARISNLGPAGGTLELPATTDEAWLSLVLNETPRNRSITIYEWHKNFAASPQTADAVAIFTGVMDDAIIGRDIQISLIESAQAKAFPFTSIDRPTYNYLVPAGARIVWGQDYLLAE